MDSQKAEDLLNLSINASEEEREKSQILSLGFDREERTWDLIVKYTESLDKIRSVSERVIPLINEYAVISIKENRISLLESFLETEYIEKPKRLFFQVNSGARASCIESVQDKLPGLTGKGVLLGIIDSGIDYVLHEFRKPDGRTRILNLWDQSMKAGTQYSSPPGYDLGIELSEQEINEDILNRETRAVEYSARPSVDFSGHGTSVAGIAASIAYECELVIVKLANSQPDGFPRTTELMMGLDYLVRKSIEYRKPIAINVSFGNTYGSHEGNSLLERYIDSISNIWKNCICIGSGNEASEAGHAAGLLVDDVEQDVELGIQEYQTYLNVQIWKAYVDDVDISIISPSGIKAGPISDILGTQRFMLQDTEILLYYGEPSPYSISQEIFIDMIPKYDFINDGVWKIQFTPRKIVSGRYELWLPSTSVLNEGTGFLKSVSNGTLTIPSTASRVVCVGAYDPKTFSYAVFSGRGRFARGSGGDNKPDLVAPGVNIKTVMPGGEKGLFSGTSFAVPFVTASAALMMEWGIVMGNDPFLYGEKIKAYLRKGAKPLPGYEQYPNNEVGWGALCLEKSLPV